MKENRPFIVCFFLILSGGLNAFTQLSYCPNLGFEHGNFTNWAGHTWLYSMEVPEINTEKVEGFVTRRHTIITDNNAYDAYTGYALKKIPPGYRYSARLGDVIIRSQDAIPRCWNQSLRYTMTIDSNNALLVIKFALVLEYAHDHTEVNEPRFRFTLFDQNGDTIPDCSNYNVYASNEMVSGWQTFIREDDDDPVKWRDWTTVGANLLDYLGQTITLEFMAADCAEQYHFGYAYFVAECHPLYITENFCAGDSVASLSAPEGFMKYRWTDIHDAVVDTQQTLFLNSPAEGTTYACQMTSATGCDVTLESTIARYNPRADFMTNMIDCNSNAVQHTNLSTTNRGTLYYNWDFGDGNSSAEKDPLYTFQTSGMHRVKLILSNPPSTCVDTITRDVESFSPPLVGIEGYSTYCPGQSVFLKAYGAYDYTWSNGSKADSVEVSAPGGAFWLLGRSSTGCVSDTIFRVVAEEPDWQLVIEGDTTFCEGEATYLLADGAACYLWSTGDTADSVYLSEPGTYSITGANTRGCEKSATFNIVEVPVPGLGYTLSKNTLDSRNNQLICSSENEAGVQYVWDMGDGSTETGSTVQHTYNISGNELAYTIILTATSQYGCAGNASVIVDVVPFVPNVFTPNDDGINDIFMAGIELEIFDRNGLSLYKGSEGWNGRYKGQTADPDTYFYYISYPDRFGQMQIRKGFVTLVR
ncbi:MAG: gliding motility-associated C-terminal domain-containing protein [Bacteroidales bacterium]|nr:gliding motility-associated C-terminal domain-containing protein [Bacteroidales bacterium]MBN2762935.1 gliding motility-associated C-terminal domain-containing protein [Bacteroidales bacterium]